MYLRKDANIASFLRSVGKCNGEVLFHSTEGDLLNLKSTLAKFIFVTIEKRKDILYSARIILKDKDDYKILGGFLTDKIE